MHEKLFDLFVNNHGSKALILVICKSFRSRKAIGSDKNFEDLQVYADSLDLMGGTGRAWEEVLDDWAEFLQQFEEFVSKREVKKPKKEAAFIEEAQRDFTMHIGEATHKAYEGYMEQYVKQKSHYNEALNAHRKAKASSSKALSERAKQQEYIPSPYHKAQHRVSKMFNKPLPGGKGKGF